MQSDRAKGSKCWEMFFSLKTSETVLYVSKDSGKRQRERSCDPGLLYRESKSFILERDFKKSILVALSFTLLWSFL